MMEDVANKMRSLLGSEWSVEVNETDDGFQFLSIVGESNRQPYSLWPDGSQFALVQSNNNEQPTMGSLVEVISYIQ